MRVLLAGAFGNLGTDILKELVAKGYEVTAADINIKEIPEIAGKYDAIKIDVTKPETLQGIFDGIDIVISTVGLTSSSSVVTNYDIDLSGNSNLLAMAKFAGVKIFNYVSVLKADSNPHVPMLDAKAKMEELIKISNIQYVIYRPTGYFYDIAKVFKPMIDKGEVTLLGKKDVHANVIDTPDFAEFVVKHMTDHNKQYDVGGNETYSYEEIAKMCFEAASKPAVIKRAPVFLFTLLAFINSLKKNGKEAVIKFSKWALTNEMVGKDKYGKSSFKQYINNYFASENRGV